MPKIDFWRKKGRKYPIKRDETGKSARQRCFKLFEEEAPLQLIAEGEDVPIKTVYKYHQQWLKDPHIKKQLAYLKTMFARENPNRDKSINQLALLNNVQSITITFLKFVPADYIPDIDKTIEAGFKFDSSVPHGYLLGEVG
jgi:hypothetical protein